MALNRYQRGARRTDAVSEADWKAVSCRGRSIWREDHVQRTKEECKTLIATVKERTRASRMLIKNGNAELSEVLWLIKHAKTQQEKQRLAALVPVLLEKEELALARILSNR